MRRDERLQLAVGLVIVAVVLLAVTAGAVAYLIAAY